jgi:hypothetical protein
MRRVAILVSIVAVALAGWIAADRSTPGTVAQDATPAAVAPMTGHPLVGSWLIDDVDNPSDPPSITLLTGEGIALDASADGSTSVGAWTSLGPTNGAATLVGVFEGEGFGASLVIRATVTLDETGDAFEGPYSFTVVAADGTTVLESGEGTVRGTRVPVEPVSAVGTPMAQIPTWTPATPEAGTPTP